MELGVDLSWYPAQDRLLFPGEASPLASADDHIKGMGETAGGGEGVGEEVAAPKVERGGSGEVVAVPEAGRVGGGEGLGEVDMVGDVTEVGRG